MSYGRWQPLAQALAPDGPGLMQVRAAQGLTDYPTGKSAMLFYGADDVQLAHALERFRQAHSGDLWVRFGPSPSGRLPSEALADTMRQFAARFGAPPLWS